MGDRGSFNCYYSGTPYPLPTNNTRVCGINGYNPWIKSCCGDAPIYRYENCTQYCPYTGIAQSWINCLEQNNTLASEMFCQGPSPGLPTISSSASSTTANSAPSSTTTSPRYTAGSGIKLPHLKSTLLIAVLSVIYIMGA